MKINIHLVSNDIALFNTFLDSGLFGKVTIGSRLEPVEYDCLIISDRLISTHDLLEQADKEQVKAKNVFFLLSNGQSTAQLSTVKVRLSAKQIKTIPPRMTDRQIFERICQEINIEARSNKNVVSFFGADSKVGTTIVAQSVAELLAENTSCNIGLLNLQGHVNFSYVKEPTEGLGMDILKTKVFNSILSSHELLAAMVNKDRLHILPSVQTLSDLRFYHPKHVEYLIDIASELFDIVIIDAGYYPNSGLYYGALNATQNRFLVATQQESCRSSFLEITKPQILDHLGISTQSFMLIINRFSQMLDYSDTYKMASENFMMTHAASLPNVSGMFWQTEIDRQTLRNYNNNEYNKSLSELTKVVAASLGIEYHEPQVKKKKGLFSWK